jgi:two-component system, OmpR family, response regulator ChvI
MEVQMQLSAASIKSSANAPNNTNLVGPEGLRVVVVDDDDLFRESLRTNLSDQDLTALDFSGGPAALHFFESGGEADVILLDWKMPGMDGLEVLKRLREQGVEVPVIFLTVLSDEIYEAAALDKGAVDFIEKSRSFSIILRRMRIIADGYRPASNNAEDEAEETSFGDLELDLKSNRGLWKSLPVPLTLREFKIVALLAGRAGQDVTYREIYDVVHGEGFVAGYGVDGYRANVRTFIKRVRQKFREVDDDFEMIENYPGFGYRWRPDGQD